MCFENLTFTTFLSPLLNAYVIVFKYDVNIIRG